MLRSRILLLSLTLFVSARASASTALQQAACEKMLGLTLISAEPAEFNLNAGLGMRGFLGSYPAVRADVAAALARQGVYFWGHSFAVKKTIAEARAHDENFDGLGKIAYLISDVDVSDLTDVTPDDVVRDRFRRIFAGAELVYWDDTESLIKGNGAAPEMKRISKEDAARIILPETINYFTRDARGPRFTQSGWVFPKIRGELNYARVFESGSSTIKNVLREARRLISQGYSVTFNTNFIEALNMVRDQARVQKDQSGRLYKMPNNSRYKVDPAVYTQALEAYREGKGFSVEVRDPAGRLMAGTLGERHGNLVKLETIFYGFEERADGAFKSHLDLAKIAVLAALKRMHEKGIDVADAGMVTPFTASLKGEYVSAERFARDIEMLRKLSPVDLDFSRPWTPE